MRGNSQLLPSMNCFLDQTGSMKTPVMLLLTEDNELEELVADALSEIGAISHLTRDAGEALEIICGANDLDFAVIDFEHGPHGMTLLSTLSTLRKEIPVIVITCDDEQHVKALAYANGDPTGERDPSVVHLEIGTSFCLTRRTRKCKR